MAKASSLVQKNGRNKFIKKTFIAFAFIIMIIIAIKIFYGISYRSVLNRYCSAVEQENGETMISIYEPAYLNKIASENNKGMKEIEKILEEEAEYWHEVIIKECGDEFRVSYKIVGLRQNSIGNDYMITLQFQAKGKNGSYYGKIRSVNVYKTNNKWYLIFNDKSWESKLM